MRYSLRRIRQNYTYTVYEIAELFNLTPDTVFRWIRLEGLKRIKPSRKYYVHSSELKRFLSIKNKKNKKPCQAHEIYCFKCKTQSNPIPESLTFKIEPNGSTALSGRCSVCKRRINKKIGRKDWNDKHPLFINKEAPIKPHSVANEQLHEYQTMEVNKDD